MTIRAALGLIAATLVAVAVGAYAGSTTPIQQQRPVPTITASPVVSGPGWVPVTPEFADALAEGDDTAPEHAATREWETCLFWLGGDDTYVIVCPDGYVTSS